MPLLEAFSCRPSVSPEPSAARMPLLILRLSPTGYCCRERQNSFFVLEYTSSRVWFLESSYYKIKKRQLWDRGFHRNSSLQAAWDTSILYEAKQAYVVFCTTFSCWGACWSKVLVLIWCHTSYVCTWGLLLLIFHWNTYQGISFFVVGTWYVVCSRYDFFFGFNSMRRNTCRSNFVLHQAKRWKQPCVAFRDQGDAAVRQIASVNDYYGYTIVNCVWPHYSSISQRAGVFCWRRNCIYVGQITILTCRSEVLCWVCILQIQPRQHALEHAVCVTPIPQRELHHTDQEYICPERASACSVNR